MVQDSVYKIILIGAGELGSRHLQGLAKLDLLADITIIDPSKDALSTAHKRLNEVERTQYTQNVRFVDSFACIEDTAADLAIVATTADVRVSVTRTLVETMNVDRILFEKVLCQSTAELDEIARLVSANRIKAWVNCPRRIYPFYSELKKRFVPAEPIAYYLHGGEWGLACNAIHFLDHLAFLVDESEFRIDTNCLDTGFVSSKRNNFIELTGTISGSFASGSEFVFHSRKGSNAPHRIYIQSRDVQVIIDETIGQMRVASQQTGWRWEYLTFHIPYQSELTNLIAGDMLRNDCCGLASLEESCRIHKPFLEGLIAHLNQCTGQIFEACPIT